MDGDDLDYDLKGLWETRVTAVAAIVAFKGVGASGGPFPVVAMSDAEASLTEKFTGNAIE